MDIQNVEDVLEYLRDSVWTKGRESRLITQQWGLLYHTQPTSYVTDPRPAKDPDELTRRPSVVANGYDIAKRTLSFSADTAENIDQTVPSCSS